MGFSYQAGQNLFKGAYHFLIIIVNTILGPLPAPMLFRSIPGPWVNVLIRPYSDLRCHTSRRLLAS